MSIFCKDFLSLYFALETFSHFNWGTDKPVLTLTDNKNISRFFQAKTIPPTLWNYIDRVTAFNTVVNHIPGKANAAADFLSRLQSDPNETSELKLTDRIPVREIEVDVRAKLPDNTNNELFTDDFPDEFLQVVDINTLIRLNQSGIYKQTSKWLEDNTEHCTQPNRTKLTQSSYPIQWILTRNLRWRWLNYRIKMEKWKTDENIPTNNI